MKFKKTLKYSLIAFILFVSLVLTYILYVKNSGTSFYLEDIDINSKKSSNLSGGNPQLNEEITHINSFYPIIVIIIFVVSVYILLKIKKVFKR